MSKKNCTMGSICTLSQDDLLVYIIVFFKKGNQIVKYFAKTDVPRDPFVHSLTVSHVFRGSRPFANSFTMEGAISSHWKKQQQRTKFDKNKSDPPLHLSTF